MVCPGISSISTTFVFQAEHNILMHPFHMLGVKLVSSVVHCSPQCTWFTPLPLHWFVKPLKLSPRTMVISSVKKKRPTTLLLHTDTLVSNLPICILQQLSFTSLLPRSMAVVGIWFTALGVSTMAPQPQRFQLQPVHPR